MKASRGTPFLTQVLVLLASLAIVALLGGASYRLGWQISLAIFYLVPIFLCVHHIGRWAGLVVSVLACATWLTLELNVNPLYAQRNPRHELFHVHPIIAIWNGLALGGFFVIFTLLLDSIESALHREKRINQNLENLLTLAPFEETGRSPSAARPETFLPKESLPGEGEVPAEKAKEGLPGEEKGFLPGEEKGTGDEKGADIPEGKTT
jgi:hypothetical protein